MTVPSLSFARLIRLSSQLPARRFLPPTHFFLAFELLHFPRSFTLYSLHSTLYLSLPPAPDTLPAYPLSSLATTCLSYLSNSLLLPLASLKHRRFSATQTAKAQQQPLPIGYSTTTPPGYDRRCVAIDTPACDSIESLLYFSHFTPLNHTKPTQHLDLLVFWIRAFPQLQLVLAVTSQLFAAHRSSKRFL